MGANKPVNNHELKEFLANNKSAIFIFVNKVTDFHVPHRVDELFKKPDFDLNDTLEKVNRLANGDFICIWRGAFARHINFQGIL